MTELIEAFGLGNTAILTNVCLLPLYPGLVAFLAGNAGHTSRRTMALLGVVVLAGVLSMMLAVGFLLYLINRSFGDVLPVVLPFIYGTVIVLGVLMIANYNPWAKMSTIRAPVLNNPFGTAYIYGLLLGPMTLPCSGPLVVSAFVLGADDTTQLADGLLYFLAFGLGFGWPLVLLPLVAVQAQRRFTGWMTSNHGLLTRVSGFLLIAIGVIGVWTEVRPNLITEAEESFVRWEARAVLSDHSEAIQALAFSPDGTRLVSAGGIGNDFFNTTGQDFALRVWTIEESTELALLTTWDGPTNKTQALGFSPNGTLVASGGWDNTVQIRDAATGSVKTTLEGHPALVVGIAFGEDGTLVTGSEDGTIQVWDTTTENVRRTLSHSRLTSLALSPDGQWLATGSLDQTIRLWETSSGDLLATLNGHTNWVLAVAFSPDGTRLASASADGTVRLWDAASGDSVVELSPTLAGDAINALAFSPDHTFLAMGLADGTVQVWDIDQTTPERTITLRGHKGPVHVVAFSERDLASAGADFTIRLWSVGQ